VDLEPMIIAQVSKLIMISALSIALREQREKAEKDPKAKITTSKEEDKESQEIMELNSEKKRKKKKKIMISKSLETPQKELKRLLLTIPTVMKNQITLEEEADLEEPEFKEAEKEAEKDSAIEAEKDSAIEVEKEVETEAAAEEVDFSRIQLKELIELRENKLHNFNELLDKP
jgi:hypothetical protein